MPPSVTDPADQVTLQDVSIVAETQRHVTQVGVQSAQASRASQAGSGTVRLTSFFRGAKLQGDYILVGSIPGLEHGEIHRHQLVQAVEGKARGKGQIRYSTLDRNHDLRCSGCYPYFFLLFHHAAPPVPTVLPVGIVAGLHYPGIAVLLQIGNVCGPAQSTCSIARQRDILTAVNSGSGTQKSRQPSRWISPILGALLFAVALWVLRRELATVRLRDVRAALSELSYLRILLAFLFSTAHYLVLTSYEQLGFLHIKKQMVRWKVIAASWLGYAISNSVGVPLLSGTTVRYRFYSRWGLNSSEFTRLVVFYSTAFVLGMIVIGGGGLVFLPPERGSDIVQVPLRILGLALLSCAPGYVVLCTIRRKPIRIGRLDLHLPTPRLAVSHLLLSLADWALGASIVYMLMPDGQVPWTIVLGAFISAQLLGLISNVPGGVGIFEGTIIVLLGSHVEHAAILSALLLYRFIYYLLPLLLALAVLVLDEAWIRHSRVARALAEVRRGKGKSEKPDNSRDAM